MPTHDFVIESNERRRVVEDISVFLIVLGACGMVVSLTTLIEFRNVLPFLTIYGFGRWLLKLAVEEKSDRRES